MRKPLSRLIPVLVAIGLGCEAPPARTTSPGEKETDTSSRRGVAVEIQERIDGRASEASVAEMELIAALKRGGVEVVVSNSEFVVRGTAESVRGERQVVYGVDAFVYNAFVRAQVIHASDGVLLDTVSAQARKVGTSPENAARDAIRTAMHTTAGGVLRALRRASEPKR